MSAETLSYAPSRGAKIGFWIATGVFTALMTFSAVLYLTQPAMVAAFTHLGFPQYFRVELAVAKLLGVVALLTPAPTRVKEWAYAGFGITVVSAFIAHLNVDGPGAVIPPFVAFALLAASYALWQRQNRPAFSAVPSLAS